MKKITCFISYSHENVAHKKRVKLLAEKLKKMNYIVRFDQFDTVGGDDLGKYIEEAVGEADKILLICTPEFARKSNNGTNVVGYEKSIITGDMLQSYKVANNKLIPVIFAGSNEESVPKYVNSKIAIHKVKNKNFYSELQLALNKSTVAKVARKKVIPVPKT